MSLRFSDFLQREAANLICGREIGRGSARRVYVYALNPAFVVKFEDDAASFQNIKEWEVWQAAKEVDFVARWLAPCIAISPCGGVLVQERTRDAFNYPDRVPAFLADFKRANYGMLGDRFVCHDYGVNLMLENGMTRRMRKANWWSADSISGS